MHILKYDLEHPVIAQLKNDLRKKGRYVLIRGDHGSGKSYIAVRIMQEIDRELNGVLKKYDEATARGEQLPNFESVFKDIFMKRIIYSPMHFINQFNPKKIKPHTVFVFDEAGTALNSWEWQEFYQTGIDKILQIGRRYRVLIIFVVPRSSKLIQSHVRLQFHYLIRTISVDYDNEENIFKFYKLDYHEEKRGETKYIYKRIEMSPNVFIGTYSFKKAHPLLIEAYEEVSEIKKNEIIQQIRGEKSRRDDLQEMVEKVMRKFHEMVELHGIERMQQMKFVSKSGDIKRAFVESLFPDAPRSQIDKIMSLVKMKLLERADLLPALNGEGSSPQRR